MDLGCLVVELYSYTKRVCCKEHGIETASVPWSYPGSRFTKYFDMTATFLAMNINKKVADEYLRCDWHSIMSCISRVREELEPDIKTSTYTLCKAHEHLSPNQAARLDIISKTNPRLFRGKN